MCQNTVLQDKLLHAQARITFLENRAGEDSDRVAEMERKMKHIEAQQREQISTGQESEARQHQLQRALAVQEDENDALKLQLDNLKKGMAAGGPATELISEQMDQVHRDLYKAEKKLDDAESRADDLWKQCEKMKHQLKQAQEAEANANATLAKMKQDVRKQRDTARELHARLDDVKKEYGKSQRENEAQRVKLRNSAAKLEASMTAHANCAKCRDLEEEIGELNKACKRLLGEKNAMKEKTDLNERSWGQMHVEEPKKLRYDARMCKRVDDRFSCLRRFLAGCMGSAIRNWSQKIDDYNQQCALRAKHFPRMKVGITQTKRILSKWTNAVMWRMIQRWKRELVEHQREAGVKSERELALQNSAANTLEQMGQSAEDAKQQAQVLMQDLDRAQQELEATCELHRHERQQRSHDFERLRQRNEELQSEIDEMEAYIESVQEAAQRELAQAERDALRELALTKQNAVEAHVALDREREAMMAELAHSRAELNRSKALMKATEEGVDNAAFKRTQVLGTGILHKKRDLTQSCIIVWRKEVGISCVPHGQILDAMQDEIEQERARFTKEHSSLARAASSDFTCSACGHSVTEAAHPVILLGDQGDPVVVDPSPGTAATSTPHTNSEDVDIALALALQRKPANESADITNLTDLHRELQKRHIQDFDFMRDGDPDRADRMCLSGFKIALAKNGLSAQPADLKSMFRAMAQSLKSKINYQTLHKHLLAAGRVAGQRVSPRRQQARHRSGEAAEARTLGMQATRIAPV